MLIRSKRIISLMILSILLLSISNIGTAIGGNNDPTILRIEQLGTELSTDINNPTVVPYFNGLKLIGNDACKSNNVDFDLYINGQWTRTGIVANFDENGEFITNISTEPGQVCALKYVYVGSKEGTYLDENKIITESPTYYIVHQDESSSIFELNGLVRTIRLTNSQLIIEARDGYQFDGSEITLKDLTTDQTNKLLIYLDNPNVTGVLTNRIVYSGLSMDSDHKYQISIEKGALVGTESREEWSNFKYNRKFVSDLIVEGSKTYNDLKDSNWAYSYIKELTEKCVVDGYKDGSFNPKGTVTRSEFEKMMVLELQIPLITSSAQTFADVPAASWDFDYVESVKQAMTGYQEGGVYYFRGTKPAVREEVAASLVKTLGLQDENVDLNELKTISNDYSLINPELQKYVLIAYKNKLIDGYPDGTFQPGDTITRAEATAMLTKVYKSDAMAENEVIGQ